MSWSTHKQHRCSSTQTKINIPLLKIVPPSQSELLFPFWPSAEKWLRLSSKLTISCIKRPATLTAWVCMQHTCANTASCWAGQDIITSVRKGWETKRRLLKLSVTFAMRSIWYHSERRAPRKALVSILLLWTCIPVSGCLHSGSTRVNLRNKSSLSFFLFYL